MQTKHQQIKITSSTYNSTSAILHYQNTCPATFLRRINRFTASVDIAGRVETVHVKNTGRLGELLINGANITLQKSYNQTRKTAYDLISVYKDGLGWVNIDSLAPNKLVKAYLDNRGYDLVRPEFTYGSSRFDFYMERGAEKYLLEVKGCTLAPEPTNRTGYFPDAPTERGVKHIEELTAALKNGYQTAVAFVIQMNGIEKVLPNNETQPVFGEALRTAAAAGVKVFAFRCNVTADNIEIIGQTDETKLFLP